MKKSLQEKLEEARIYSVEHPDIIVYVIDKHRCKPKMYTVGWCAIEQINHNGYYPVASFKNGKRNDIKER